MLGRFSNLSRFAIKLIEVAGAGCASAIVAFALDNSRHPPIVPAVPPPAVVRLAPADAQMIETVRSESVALAHLRGELEARAAPAPLPPAKPVKPATSPAAKRDQKPPHLQAAEVKQRVPEAKPVQIEAKPGVLEAKPVLNVVPYPDPSAVPYPAPPSPTTSTDSADRTSAVTAGKDQGLAPPAPRSSSWLARLGSAADIPRPPAAVGQFAASDVN